MQVTKFKNFWKEAGTGGEALGEKLIFLKNCEDPNMSCRINIVNLVGKKITCCEYGQVLFSWGFQPCHFSLKRTLQMSVGHKWENVWGTFCFPSHVCAWIVTHRQAHIWPTRSGSSHVFQICILVMFNGQWSQITMFVLNKWALKQLHEEAPSK